MFTTRLSTWLKPAKSKSIRTHRRGRRACPQRSIPRLEVLEDRALPSTLTVTSLADSGPGSLRDAIAGASSGDTINFDTHLKNQTIVLSSGPLTIGKDLDIEGLQKDRLTVSGNEASRVFSVARGATVTIAQLTIANGLDQVAGQGGGIDNAGTLTVSGCIFFNNEALGTVANRNGVGGGIFNEPGATLTVAESAFLNNQVIGGPRGLGFGGGIMNRGTATITDSTFSDNQATGGAIGAGAGGAISSRFNSPLAIRNSTFTDNVAIDGFGSVGKGGAIDNRGSSLTVSDSTFTRNQALTMNPRNSISEGGAITNFLATCAISNSTFT